MLAGPVAGGVEMSDPGRALELLGAGGAAAAGRAIAAGVVTPVELVDACIDRIEHYNGAFHSFLLPCLDRARQGALTASHEIAAGRSRGPLHGVPFAVKDIFHVRGLRTSAASRLTEGHVADHDAAVVERLEAAGAILIGKLNTWEFGTGTGAEYFDLPNPPAANPWDIGRFPGGSSTGAGASVAAMMTGVAVGTDTGGSVRFPAAATGTQGLKPTFGRISRHGILPNCWSLDAAGPIAWTVEDCALVLQATAGFDTRDPGSADVPVDEYLADLDAGVAGLTIGFLRDPDPELGSMDAAVQRHLDEAARILAAEGATIVPVDLPAPMTAYRQSNMLINWSESFSIHEQRFLNDAARMGQALRDKMMHGFTVRAADYLAAQRRRRELAGRTEALLQGVDVLLMPMTFHVSPRFAQDDEMRAFTREAATSLFNLTGHPAMSVCSGFDGQGLPTSIQFAARWFGERTLLRVASAYERATAWRDRRPDLDAVIAAAAKEPAHVA